MTFYRKSWLILNFGIFVAIFFYKGQNINHGKYIEIWGKVEGRDKCMFHLSRRGNVFKLFLYICFMAKHTKFNTNMINDVSKGSSLLLLLLLKGTSKVLYISACIHVQNTC